MNLKYQTYCHAIAAGGETEWSFAWLRYQNGKVASEKKILLQALGCSKDLGTLKR